MVSPIYRFLILVVFFHALWGEVSAQQIGISPIQINDKLPSQTINCVFNDSEGYIWFGSSDGISQYDGYRIVSFKPDYEQDDVNSEHVLSINETDTHLLIGTAKGLFLLDKRTRKTSQFPDVRLRDSRINRIFIDSDHNIWLGTAGPVYVYHADFTLKRSFVHQPGDLTSIPGSSTNAIFEDDEGNIWACFWNEGIHLFDKSSNRFKAYPRIGINNNPFKIFQDNKKQLWICTWGDGIYQFNPDDPSKPLYHEIVLQNKRRPGEKEAILYDIVQDDVQSYIWAVSYSGISALRYLPDGSIGEVDLSGIFEKTTNIFNNIYKDKKGNLWLSIVGEGMSHINFNKPNIRNYELTAIKDRYRLSTNLNMVFEDSNNMLWFDQRNIGLGLFDPKSGRVSVFTDYPDLKNIVALRALSCAIEMADEIWLGAYHTSTINIFKKGRKLQLKRIIELKYHIPDIGNPLSFFKDREGNLWLATMNSLARKAFDKTEFEAINIPPNYINGITQDAQGMIWVGTRNSGIYKIDPNHLDKVINLGKQTKNLGTDHIESLTADDKGNVWIGTKDNRLIAYRGSTNDFEEFINPFFLSNSQILDVIYHDNHVWVSTPRKIFRINPHSKTVFEYAAEDGLNVSLFVKQSFFPNKETHEIYFGGNNGISVLKASAVPPAETYKTAISDIKINNKSVIQDYSGEKYDFKTLQLTLGPDDQNIEIDFSALEYQYPHKIRYAYKMEGIDKDWIYAPGDRTFVTYNNLSKGNYKFLIRSTDLSKQWSNNITELTIHKKPAYYESNIAYLLYFLVIAGLSYYMIQFSLYRLKLRSDLKIAQIEKEKANELTQTKLKYFTNISHDLLTPLTIISCLVDDVEITNKKNLPQFEKMRSNINRLKRLLQQILDFRKVESGNMELKISKGDIVHFIEELCRTYFSPLAKKKNIDFHISYQSIEPNAYFDVDKVDKIIFNLLSNAFKYTLDGGKVEVAMDIHDSDGHPYLQVQITDTGVGIPAAEIDKVFIQFYNHKSAHKNESNGIGLALTKDLVEIHHGSISVQSEWRKGTCFTIRLPIDKNSYTDTDLSGVNDLVFDEQIPLDLREEIADTPDENSSDCSERLNLLLVEDNEDLLATVNNVLSKNYHVTTATNGREALECMKIHEIDIIISDVMMPELDGLELCKRVKNDMESSHIPFILLTAKNSVSDRIACYDAGADAYISKPFDLKVLEARINNFVSNKRTKQVSFKASPTINISQLDYQTLDEQFLNNAFRVIEEHLADDNFEVMSLADSLHMSKSTLYRKIKALLGISPSELIKNIRLKHACQIMERDKSISVTEVAFSTGFSDPRYFATCFKAEFGVTPSEYQKQRDEPKP